MPPLAAAPAQPAEPLSWHGSTEIAAGPLAVNGRGAVAIVNSSLEPGERSRVWLIRSAF